MIHRKRRRSIEHSGHAHYLTFSCFGRLPLFKNDVIKDAFVDQLTAAQQRQAFELAAWVVMPEHVHLLLRPGPRQDVAQTLSAIKRPFAARVLRRWRQLGAPILPRLADGRGHAHFWLAGGGYDRNIVNDDERREKIDYIHANPVRRGLVQMPNEWKWSSATWWHGDRTCGPCLTMWQ